jgi:uncharacterized protein
MLKNKRKILNDPVYGFISIPDDLIFDIIEHPYFQRLRRIQQLGLTHYVYPGALHTRFHHALGAMHLMDSALEVIRSKGTQISEDEYLGAILAILLHDIGHGPFSHALEHSIVSNIAHEDISLAIMKYLNKSFSQKLEIGLQIFKGTYPRAFFHQLVSGQLDVDRLDYLTRDSFFTGVSEGVIGTERILKMMNVYNNELVIEEKGIYSIEKFLISRQLMYWQVYLHKTVISAEILLIKVLQRAQFLCSQGVPLSCVPALKPFLSQTISKEEFLSDGLYLNHFCKLDDFDIISSMKSWMTEADPILKDLSTRIIDRKLFRTILSDTPFEPEKIRQIQKKISLLMNIPENETSFYLDSGEIRAQAYDPNHNPVKILFKNGTLKDVTEASSTINLGLISGQKTKYYVSFPKEAGEIINQIFKDESA